MSKLPTEDFHTLSENQANANEVLRKARREYLAALASKVKADERILASDVLSKGARRSTQHSMEATKLEIARQKVCVWS